MFILFRGGGEELALGGVTGGDEGRSDSVDRVNQGGVLGRVSSRVFFAASELLDAKLE